VQHGTTWFVAKGDVLERDMPVRPRQSRRATRLAHFRLRFEHFQDTLQTRANRPPGGMDAREGLHLVLQGGEVNEEDQQAADRKRAFQHVPGAIPKDCARAKGGDETRAEAVDAAQHRASLLGAHRVVGELPEAVLLAVFLHEGLHHRNSSKGLLKVGLDTAFDLPLELRSEVERFADEERCPHHEGRDQQGQKRESRIQPRHEKHHQCHGYESVAGRKEDRVHELVNAPAVARNPAHRIAHRMPAVKKQRAPLQSGKQALGEIIDHPPASHRPRRRQHEFDDTVEGEEQQSAHGGEGQHPQWGRLELKRAESGGQRSRQRVLAQHVIGHEFHRPRLKRGQRGGEQREDGYKGESATMRLKARPKKTPKAREGTPPLRWCQRLT
jgi:hypothetical protein